MATRYNNPSPQYFDTATQAPLSGGKLFFFEPTGSTTPKDTFSNEAGTIANTNPVILDKNGVVPDIFGTGDYRVVLQNKDGVQQSVDDPVNFLLSETDISVQVFDDSSLNPQTWTRPEGVKFIIARIVAGGAGGGASGTVPDSGGGGGGSGAYAKKILDVRLIPSFTVTVGAGGLGGIVTDTAAPGGGDSIITDGTSFAVGVAGGSGGNRGDHSAASGGNGGSKGNDADVDARGNAGGLQSFTTAISGAGAGSFYGGSVSGVFGDSVGKPSSSPGAGGGGGSTTSGTNFDGGIGADGQVEITEYR